MGSTYSTQLNENVSLYILAGVIIVILGGIWFRVIINFYEEWTCKHPQNMKHREKCESRPRGDSARFMVIACIFTALVFFFVRIIVNILESKL